MQQAGGQNNEGMDEQHRRVQQNSINRRLARLSRKTENMGIHLLEDASGDVQTDETVIAQQLAAHWRR
eukprot:5254646-Pyramimonas_sp.AAC.1